VQEVVLKTAWGENGGLRKKDAMEVWCWRLDEETTKGEKKRQKSGLVLIFSR
jgi:hypothetical protein